MEYSGSMIGTKIKIFDLNGNMSLESKAHIISDFISSHIVHSISTERVSDGYPIMIIVYKEKENEL